ncbi:MAG: hypothetical protein ACYC6N_23475 [Pirellulaceae bacterium]
MIRKKQERAVSDSNEEANEADGFRDTTTSKAAQVTHRVPR